MALYAAKKGAFMLINNKANDILKKARKAYKKPIPVKLVGPVSTENVISSWENDHQIAKPGDYIVTGVKGQKYPLASLPFLIMSGLISQEYVQGKIKNGLCLSGRL